MKSISNAIAALALLSLPAIAQAQDRPVAGSSVVSSEAYFESIIANGYSARKLIGATVFNDREEKVGKVHDLIVGIDGSVTLAIVEVDRFLGVDNKRVAVPARLFEAGSADGVILPGATEARLRALPTFHYVDEEN